MNASEGTGKMTPAADMTAGFLLFPGVEELDFAGPWEMFSVWSAYANGPGKCLTVSESGGNVRCAKGLRINADLDFESCPKMDVLLVPGGEGVYREVENSKLIEFVSNQAARCSHILAVCTGTFILAKAGLLNGKCATTHWASLNRLRAIHGVEVTEERYVHDGPVWTAAGVSAGLDMALAFISLGGGPKAAGIVQLGSEYYPSPDDYQLPPIKEALPGYINKWKAKKCEQAP
jgi:transcriptional regulator GlxA family with amidase domain